MKIKIILAFLLIFGSKSTFAQFRVENIIIEREDVFEKHDKDWFFASSFLNLFHTKTNAYIVEDELLFKKNEFVDDDYLFETERNLRSTGLFTKVKIELDSVRPNTYDVYVVTKDRWSLYPALLFGSGGGYTNYGGKIDEYNLFGTGTKISGEAQYRNESDIGWQGTFELSQRRLFRTKISLDFSLIANKYRTEQKLDLVRKYLTLDDKISYGVSFLNQFGKDLLYIGNEGNKLLPMNETVVSGYFSRAWWRTDRVFFTALAEYHNADRGAPKYERAYDNSGKLLFAFSSASQDYYLIENVNSHFPEDVTIGGWGSAVLGKVFPIGSKGESFYYVAGQGERSYMSRKLYLFGQLTGASAFTQGYSYYTYQEFSGVGFYKILDNLLFATNIRQQTVWNWYALRQLILDTESGLRGYALNSLSGDNRIISNLELRYFPNVELWLFKLSGVAFFDVGSAWNQDTKISKARFYSSVGGGLRLHFNKSDNPKHIFRIDLAYNLDEKKFGGIVISTQQMFSAFRNHEFRLPELFGLEFDYE